MNPFDSQSYRLMKNQALIDSVFKITAGAVEGDIAEFGLMHGDSFSILAAAMANYEPTALRVKIGGRHLHGFDSFQGMPKATHPADTEAPMVQLGIWGEGTCNSPGVDAIRKLAEVCLPRHRVELHAGWFKDTLPLTPLAQKFGLVHLDCDLYESTADVLEHLFSRNSLSDGAILMFDDFLENRASKRLGQRRAWEQIRTQYFIDITDLGFYSRAGWRCIVHQN